ncbi:SDR family NAD(P)-dependent oxidoreductase [Actinacidiphila glaucinigra]|uniref:SDR family NAD(P)-dependent oxidoreductase n=1 Tax=Actinacidiphila glaucinigra TaxID=235986 RepID=UPI0035DEA1AF
MACVGSSGECSMATWRRIVEVNLVGSALTARAFLPQSPATRGYYLWVSSLVAIGAATLTYAHCGSRSGVEAFTHSLRAEVARRGVHAVRTTSLPGLVAWRARHAMGALEQRVDIVEDAAR